MTLTKRTMAESLERRIVELPLGGTRYCVIGPKMAVDFHVDDLDRAYKLAGLDVDDLDRAYKLAGLECHYSECPTYMEGKEPFTESCWLTGVRCWGDGTTLYATERLLPMFEARGVEDFWPILENEWRRRYRDTFGEATA
jgi:hypothetical protein